MRVLDPNRELDQFQARLHSLENLYARTYQDVVAGSNGLDLRKGLASDFAFRLGGEWEVFVHRWHIACISNAPAMFVASVQAEIDKAVARDNLKSHLETIRRDSTRVPTRPTANQIERFLDPKGFNVTFEDSEVWIREASAQLDRKHAGRVRAIHSSDEASSCLDLLRAIRNNIAHGSDGSGARLNTYARARPKKSKEGLVGKANDPLLRPTKSVKSVAVYLHGASGKPLQQRVQHLSRRVREISELLRVV